VDLYRLQGDSLPYQVFFTGCSGTCAPVPAAPPPPPSSLTLVFAELLLSHHLTPPSNWHCSAIFSAHLKHDITEVLPLSLTAAGPSWSHPALALLYTGEASSSFSQKPPL